MKNNFKKVFKVFTFAFAVVALFLLGIIAYGFITDYKPEPIEPITIHEGVESHSLKLNKDYNMVSFNIGYGALGKEQDFFMDGGKNSGAHSFDEVEHNTQFFSAYLEKEKFDFILLQEVDISGKRSYNVNQFDILKPADYYGMFAKNYDVKFVPVPFTRPMGGAVSGIATLSKAKPATSLRYSFDGKEMAIQQIFDLKRAFSLTTYPVENSDKQLVLINAHFSAFDKGGSIRKQQLAQMQKVLIEEQQKGNYVILGGDFNHELPGTDASSFVWTDPYPEWIMRLPEDFTPTHYTWAVDGQQASVRGVDKAYVPNNTFQAVIDGFLVSDNIQIVSVQGRGDFEFEHSDHNPVELKFILK